MINRLRFISILFLFGILINLPLQAFLTVIGNGTAPTVANGTSWASAPTVASFYRPTGEYYFGSSATNAYSIAYASYRTANSTPVLTPVGGNIIFTAAGITIAPGVAGAIGQLAIIPYSGDATSPTIAATVPATTNVIDFLTKTNSSPVASRQLLDTVGGTVPGSNTTIGIRALCASNDLGTNGTDIIFAAVEPAAGLITDSWGANATTGTTGGITSGLQALLLGRDTATNAPIIRAYHGGTTVGNALSVDLTRTGFYLLGSALGTTTFTLASPETGGLAPALWYDSILNRLYVGITGSCASSGVGNMNGLITVGIFPVTKVSNTSITIGTQLAPLSGTPTNATAGVSIPTIGTGIIAIQPAGGTASFGAARILRTMHTSTGFIYLIIQGGTALGFTANTIAANTANLVYAVPLVLGTPTATNAVGTFADVTTGNYQTRASYETANTLITTTSPAACVGGSTGNNTGIPVSTTFNNITDMYVDGDAIYVAAGTTAANGTNDPGIWKSQPLFDNAGKIDHWTDWQRVSPTDMGGGATDNGTDGRITFAAVDGYTGHLWATQGLYTKVTQWSAPATPTTLPGLAAAVNTALNNNCYSVLDLNASVSGWGATTPARITLFGGQEQVCFALTGSAIPTPAVLNGNFNNVNAKLGQSLANSAYDYTNSGTFLTTTLPSGAGAVISLAYSGWNSGGNSGFFFAGTAGTKTVAPGLYVWAATAGGAGFNPIIINNDLRQSPFASGYSWQQINSVQGMPIKIVSNAGAVHVLASTPTFFDRIYSCPVQTTLAGINTGFVVTASCGYAPIAGSDASNLLTVRQIYDILISVSAAPGNPTPAVGNEQLLMKTNDAVFTTSSSAGMQNPTTQLSCGWRPVTIPFTKGVASNYFTEPLYTRSPETFWVTTFIPNPQLDQSIYNIQVTYQANRQSLTENSLINSITFLDVPSITTTFNGATVFAQTTAPVIYKNFPIIYRFFYSDGARRFFIVKKNADDKKYSILVLPYNLYDYNINADNKKPMEDTFIAQAGSFYWISPIGTTGRLALSTENGIYFLQ